MHVVPRGGGGWEVRETANGPVLARTATKGEALGRAVITIEGNGGVHVVVLGSDGSLQRTIAVDPAPPRPWWYLRPGLLRWLIPVLLGLQLALRVVAWDAEASHLVLTVGFLVAFAWSLLAVLRSRALDRARQPGLDDA